MTAAEISAWLAHHRAVMLQTPHPTMCVIKIVSLDDPADAVMVQHHDIETAISWAVATFEMPSEKRQRMAVLCTGKEPVRC